MPRDKMIQQGHGDGLDSYKALFDKQKDINSELRDSLSDLRNRSKDLVETLGFDDIMQARVYLETQRSKGQVVKYRDRFREIDRLQDELKDAKALIQKMESREKDLEEENSVLRRARDESGSAYRKLTKEHKNLEDKYHDAVRAHEAAALLREKDMAKWKSFKQWIFCAAELAQFQKYDEEYGFSGRDKAKELFRIVTGKKYKLSQLDTLDDEKLFDLCGQNMDVHLPSPPTVLNRSSDLRSVPFSPSSKVNQQKSSPSLSLNSNATPTPHALVGLYARKNNTTTPVSTKAERRPDHNIGTLNVHSPEGESRAFVSPLLPTAAASKPAIILAPDSSQDQSQHSMSPSPSTTAIRKPAVVLAPDSETEDETQSFPARWSQFQKVNNSRHPDPPVLGEFVTSTPAGPFGSSRRPLDPFDSSPDRSPTFANTKPTAQANLDQSESSRRGASAGTNNYPPNYYPEPRSTSLSRRQPVEPESELEGDEYDEPPRARKYRRSDEGTRIAVGNGSNNAPDTIRTRTATTTSKPRRQSGSGIRSPRRRSPPDATPSPRRGGGREKENDTSVRRMNDGDRSMEGKRKGKAPALPTPKGPLDDYSMYKGRGRYGKGKGKDKEQGDTTINELYEIDPARNGGLDFEYDEVVRGKEKRKRLLGGDCDDCREYYRAVGPLPPRLQPPVWKSPVKNRDASPGPCNHHRRNVKSTKRGRNDGDGDDDSLFDIYNSPPRGATSTSTSTSSKRLHQDRRHSPSRSRTRNQRTVTSQDIETHKQAISRHRAAWPRGNTPPGYWDIGFPNTQMAEDINERAREMQKRKMEEVEKEAKRDGGRYRRR